MPNRLPLTPAERADLREKANDMLSLGAAYWDRMLLHCGSRYIAAISPDRLLALLDEVERLEHDVAENEAYWEALGHD